MKVLRDFYFADLRFFEVSGNIGVRAGEREGSTSSFENFEIFGQNARDSGNSRWR